MPRRTSARLTLDVAEDVAVHWGDAVTFTVDVGTDVSNAMVKLTCTQEDVVVYRSFGHGYAETAKPWFTLKSVLWMKGGAQAFAELYTVDRMGRSRTLATLSFEVEA